MVELRRNRKRRMRRLVWAVPVAAVLVTAVVVVWDRFGGRNVWSWREQ
jgi:hypothetical protein